MRIVSFIIAILLILTGGGCLVTWVSSGPRLSMDEISLITLAFGVLPLIGGALLWRYAWKDRKGGGPS